MALPAYDLATVPQVDVTPDNITRIVDRATERSTAMGKRISTFEAQVIEFRTKKEAEHQSMVSNADPSNRDILAAALKQDANRAAADYRANLLKGTEGERQTLHKDLLAVSTQLDALDDYLGSPTTMLMRHGLGSTERTNYLLQLASAGPVELQTAAKLAIMTQNRSLGSAILSVLERMPRDKRPFSGAQLAERLVSSEFKELKDKIAKARSDIKTARSAHQAFTTGRNDPLAKITRGLLQKDN